MACLYITEHPVAGWTITAPDGQHTHWIDGTRQEALSYAHHLLEGAAGSIILDNDDP